MPTGAITGYIDVAQLVLYAFWIFFAGLIFYLRREDKREGYPLESDAQRKVQVVGFPSPPPPKTFHLRDGTTRTVPRPEPQDREIAGAPIAPWPGAPLAPSGDPLLSGVGPSAVSNREDVPDTTVEGEPKLAPLRVERNFEVSAGDPDPRGMTVVGFDGVAAGRVVDLWVDRAEPRFLYYEVEVAGQASPSSAPAASVSEAGEEGEAGPAETPATGAGSGPARVLVPVNLTRLRGAPPVVRVKALLGEQITRAPRLRNPDQMTRLEEDRITAYFGAGHLFGTVDRRGPLL